MRLETLCQRLASQIHSNKKPNLYGGAVYSGNFNLEIEGVPRQTRLFTVILGKLVEVTGDRCDRRRRTTSPCPCALKSWLTQESGQRCSLMHVTELLCETLGVSLVSRGVSGIALRFDGCVNLTTVILSKVFFATVC